MKGYSIQQLAWFSDVSKQAISLHKKNKMAPSSETIMQTSKGIKN
jgi:predicted transcriptional regulator